MFTEFIPNTVQLSITTKGRVSIRNWQTGKDIMMEKNKGNYIIIVTYFTIIKSKIYNRPISEEGAVGKNMTKVMIFRANEQ
jgi:hypothetical protein